MHVSAETATSQERRGLSCLTRVAESVRHRPPASIEGSSQKPRGESSYRSKDYPTRGIILAAVPVQSGIQADIGQYVDGLQKHLRGKLASDEDAADIAQEACVKLLQALRKDRGIRNPRAYLYRIAQHLLYRHYKGCDRRPAFVEQDVDTLANDGGDIEALAVDAIRRQQINRAIRELSPKCRRVLRLRWVEGLQVDEIAGVMGLSRAMVKKYLANGLAHCRTRLRRFVLDRSEL